MKLDLDPKVLDNHKQYYPDNCVTMGVELVLKLMKVLEADSFGLQLQIGDVQRSGDYFHNNLIYGVRMTKEFGCDRGPYFPLPSLFDRIKSELGNGNYVNCAWHPKSSNLYHAFIIYGYEGDEFLAITYYYNDPKVKYISDMGTKLRDIQGSDIITFTRV